MELIGASWIIFIKYTSYILSKLEKLKYLENLPVFFKILLVGYCIHINSVKSANKIVPYLIFYSTPWFGQCDWLSPNTSSLDIGRVQTEQFRISYGHGLEETISSLNNFFFWVCNWNHVPNSHPQIWISSNSTDVFHSNFLPLDCSEKCSI